MTITAGPNIGQMIHGELGDEHYLALMSFLRSMDFHAQPVIKTRSLATPPASPGDGDTYIVADAPFAAWSSQGGKIARYYTKGAGAPGWEFYTPKEGWSVVMLDEQVRSTYIGGEWSAGVDL